VKHVADAKAGGRRRPHRLADLLFESFRDLREEVAVIADENIHKARHIQRHLGSSSFISR